MHFAELHEKIVYEDDSTYFRLKRKENDMNDKDTEILRKLTLNARISAAELGRALGMSRVTVQNRIDRLKASGVIARFTIELGDGTGSLLVEAAVLIKLKSGDSRPTVARLTRVDEVISLTSINGSFDLIAELRAGSLKQLDEVLASIRMLPAVVETNSNIRLNRFK